MYSGTYLHQQETLSPSEVQFFSQDELITIIPNFHGKKISLLCGDFGPFEPLIPVNVPIWLAIQFKKNRKCNIRAPEWMEIAHLKEKMDSEVSEDNTFEVLPFHYVEIATQLLDSASDDISQADKVRTLLEDIWSRRAAKIRKGLLSITANSHALKLNNLSAMEINGIRSLATQALQQFYTLSTNLDGQ